MLHQSNNRMAVFGAEGEITMDDGLWVTLYSCVYPEKIIVIFDISDHAKCRSAIWCF
jgi:hypothetical protein